MKRLVCSKDNESVERTSMTANHSATMRRSGFSGGTPLRTSSRAVIRQGSVADMQKSVS